MCGKQVKKELRQRGNIRKRENAYCWWERVERGRKEWEREWREGVRSESEREWKQSSGFRKSPEKWSEQNLFPPSFYHWKQQQQQKLLSFFIILFSPENPSFPRSKFFPQVFMWTADHKITFIVWPAFYLVSSQTCPVLLNASFQRSNFKSCPR